MAHENMNEWEHNSLVEQETVRAVVEAFAEGKIELPPTSVRPGKAGAFRLAPLFTVRKDTKNISARAEMIYTTATLAEFLGWKDWKVEASLAALSLIEEDLATKDQFEGLSSRQALS